MYKTKMNGTPVRVISEDEARAIINKYDEDTRIAVIDAHYIDGAPIKELSKIFSMPIMDVKVIIFMNTYDSVCSRIKNDA